MIPKDTKKPNDLRRKDGGKHVYHWLDTFLRVADAGSFNKAAEESHITPNAVIKQINLLEAELGIRLLKELIEG